MCLILGASKYKNEATHKLGWKRLYGLLVEATGSEQSASEIIGLVPSAFVVPSLAVLH